MNLLFKRQRRFCLLLGAAGWLSGCGAGGVEGAATNAGGALPSSVISGVASKGPLDRANIKVYRISGDGTKGEQLGANTQTGADGSYSIDIGDYSGPVLVEASGGSYVDEATGLLTPLASPLRAAVVNVSGNSTVAVTALTEMSVRLAQTTDGRFPLGQVGRAQQQVEQNIANNIDIVKTLPADVLRADSAGKSQDEKEYGILLAAVAEHAQGLGLDGAIQDLSGLASGSADLLQQDELKQALRKDMSDFVATNLNQSGVTDPQQLAVYANVGGSVSPLAKVVATTTGSYTLLAWNDLGMHCVDGKDYSVFSLLPPYNNLHAQLVNSGAGKAVTSGVSLTYESVADSTGSINTFSVGKTNFWSWVQPMFGVRPANNVGLKGNFTPSKTPRPMTFDATNQWFGAEGIPITPYDDKGVKNYYPMVKVVARDGAGRVLATARTVLPVSDEMTCRACHSSTSGVAAKPAAGWVLDADPEKDWKKNILRLHDEKNATNTKFIAALKLKGYSASGLLATSVAGQPILCATCHSSNALPGLGVSGISPLTQALHSQHASVNDPLTGLKLDNIVNRSSCYSCHPGSVTKCLRGAMGNALDSAGNQLMSCQSCHGTMTNVGASTRTGWLQEPNCQACHHDSKRETSGVTATGQPKTWSDQRFATNANKPAAGFSLFRFSTGHGGLQCEACHGATHAEYPSSHLNDNVLSLDVQGHVGTINECTSCHKSVPLTANAGPHGMHTIGSSWVSGHGDFAEKSANSCTYCHGTDYKGSFLSQVKTSKTFAVEGKSKAYKAGDRVGCYDCHNGPRGD